MEQRRVAVIGAPSGAGACGVGQEQSPTALRAAGLNPHNAAADDGLLERFAAAFADAIG